MLTIIIVPTLQRRNVVRDAPRHTFMTRRALKIGRRASRTAFLRWSVRNDNLNCRAMNSIWHTHVEPH
ncbi:DUF1534 domain-containing protein [Pseudomonas syringae pv. actinidiae]|nr:DUF1534 domain-containing protein [Pseudomonas syringae pv. actinidiae]AYL82927.1 DUF1534 domain-containing protein [Pseudomonas syringae pv. actinidiae str. Shaanxi_M228]NAS68375.1 DUF1534 domain-containing protein [Pseudomonas syringae pv. actinidiae]NAT29008.1 DUF1534 domain-containing protein [Pseudomonas syringae pv. actinidiae]NAT34062.1 DUF1534 domain-containing protein [Pseudomonas syringae pv. actinidiae]